MAGAFPLRSIPPLAAFVSLAATRPKQCRRGRFSHFVRALAYPLLHLLSVRSAARNSSAAGPPIQTPWVARVFTQACYACGPSSRALARRGDMLRPILPAAPLCGCYVRLDCTCKMRRFDCKPWPPCTFTCAFRTRSLVLECQSTDTGSTA